MKALLIRLITTLTCLALMVSSAMVNGAPAHDFVGKTDRSDGSSVDWKLSRAASSAPLPILLAAQGSGCTPASSNSNIARLESAFSGFAVLTIEKYGVEPQTVPEDPMNGCSEAYYANYTVTRAVEDAKLVLEDLRSRALWGGQLVLFGASEGGAVVSILSHELKDVDAVMVFSSSTGLTMRESLPMVVPPKVAKRLSDMFAEARGNPQSSRVVGGNSLKWWADILDRRLSDDLLKSSVPVLLVHGRNDKHSPVAAARATRDAFADAGESNRLTYWELADRDHQMRDASGRSHLNEVLDMIAEWARAAGLSRKET